MSRVVQGLGIRLPLQGDVGAIPSLETGSPRDMGNQAHWPRLEPMGHNEDPMQAKVEKLQNKITLTDHLPILEVRA